MSKTSTPQTPQQGEAMTVTGIAHSRGSAVDCAKVKMDDGEFIGVSLIPADIELGQRVEVTGTYGYQMTCNSDVILVETMKRL